MNQTNKQISHSDSQSVEALCQKVDELEKLIETISRSKMMWESTFDVISDPVLIINSNFEIKRANKALAKACDLDIRKVISKKCYEVFAGHKQVCPKCPVFLTIEKQKPQYCELDMFPQGGRQYNVTAYSTPHVFQDQDESIVLHYRDITDEKQLQKKLMHSEKMAAVGTLAGGVAHEINNPLGGILAFVQLVLRELGEKHSCHDDLKEIEDAALRCKKIVRNLLDFSREKTNEKMESVQLSDVVAKTMSLIFVNARHGDVKVEQEIDKDLPPITGDFNKLQQVVLNMVTNSLHSMRDKGGVLTLCLFTNPERQKVFLQVVDTGEGIDSKDLNRIFDPYFTTKKQGEGTGLGLSISYKIIQDHKGKIDIDSKRGSGTTVTIQFPALAY